LFYAKLDIILTFWVEWISLREFWVQTNLPTRRVSPLLLHSLPSSKWINFTIANHHPAGQKYRLLLWYRYRWHFRQRFEQKDTCAVCLSASPQKDMCILQIAHW